MPKNFYISDWHYGHENVIHFDNRPFKLVEEMNEDLIVRWNKVVSAGDTVYILGDMFWIGPEGAAKVMDRLNGRKVLIKGNHDRCKDVRFREKFVKIADYLEIEDSNQRIILCHYPIPCFKNHFYGAVHLYGHVHSTFEWNMMEHQRYLMEELYGHQCNMINVGAMMPWIEYIPRTLDEIMEGYGAWKAKHTTKEESDDC